MEKINEAVGMNDLLTMAGGKKRLVRHFRRQDLWKFSSCVLPTVTYEKKGQHIWSEISKPFGNKAPAKFQIDLCGNTDLYQVCCDLYV